MAIAGNSLAANLDIADFCDLKIAAPASVKEMTPLNDGATYAAISDDEKSIEIFSYKTGKKIGTLFDINSVKGDVKISSFDGFSISDNGKKVLLWNDIHKIYRHSFTAEYYVYDTMRSTLAKVSDEGPQRGAILSHDGRLVAYVRDNNIYISNLDYKTDRPITEDGRINNVIYGVPDWGYEEEFGIINTMRWSGDDNTLAFIRFDESKVPSYSFDNYKSYCDSDPLSDEYPQPYTYKYSLSGYPNSIVSVFAYDLNNRTTKKMELPIAESDYIPSMEFDGAGTNLMIMTLNRDQNDLKLYKVNTGSTIAKLIYSEKGETWLSPSAYQMVRYYNDFFILGSTKSGYRHLYQYSYSGSLIKELTKGDFNVTEYYGYNPRTGKHYLQTTSLGAINRSIASVDKTGKITLLHNIEGTEKAWFSSDYSYYLRSYSSATTPPEFSLWDTNGKKLIVVEDNKVYTEKYKDAPRMEFLKVKNDEGKEMNAYIIKPSDFDPSKKYPLMMYQYNGPESQEVLNKWRMEGIFYIASQGYIVAAVDGRGTGNREYSWATAVYKNLGHFETLDQISGAKFFSSLPYIDSDRISCFGWSYGGYMTLMELSQPGNPFKAGISMAPVVDWRYYDSIYTERYMLTPSQNKDGYDASSALNRTENMNRSLLIMSGTSDDNVHFYNTLKYTSKLNSEGTLFDMMAFTGFEHSLRMCNARIMLFRKVKDFLDIKLSK